MSDATLGAICLPFSGLKPDSKKVTIDATLGAICLPVSRLKPYSKDSLSVHYSLQVLEYFVCIFHVLL